MHEYPYWWDTVPALGLGPDNPKPPADIDSGVDGSRFDVVVVGAGYTGLAAGRQLARIGASVLIVEREQVGWGASSRNGGQVLTGLKLDPAALVARCGEARARRLFDAALASVERLESLIREESLHCDYRRSGHIQLAAKAAHFRAFVREATDEDRAAARELFTRDFGRTKIVAYGEVMDIDQMPALVAVRYEDPSGALAYRLHGDALHIVALATDPMWQRSGVGGHLVAEAELIARRLKLRRLVVSTTNDNLPALYFYQRLGYRMTHFVSNSVIMHTGQEVAGFAGIPVRDEVRLEKMIAGES